MTTSGDLERLDRLRGGVLELAMGSRVPERLVDRIGALALPGQRVVHDHRQLAERLERGPLHDVIGVAPVEQHPLAILVRKRCELGVPALDQAGEPVPDVGARVGSHRTQDHVGDVQIGRRRKAVLSRGEGVADRVETGAAARAEHDRHVNTSNYQTSLAPRPGRGSRTCRRRARPPRSGRAWRPRSQRAPGKPWLLRPTGPWRR
jgi:hypothetical protein